MTGEGTGSVLSSEIKKLRMLTVLDEGEGNTDNCVNLERVIIGFFGVIDPVHVLMFLTRNSGDPRIKGVRVNESKGSELMKCVINIIY